MALSSMTGFARAGGTVDSFQWTMELKSVNGRTLELRARTPSGFDAVVEHIRGVMQKSLARGQCQLTLSVNRSDSAPRVSIDEEALTALLDRLARIPLPDCVGVATLDGLLAAPGIVRVDEGPDPAGEEAVTTALNAAGTDLVAALKETRRREGQALEEIILKQMDQLEELVRQADAHPARSPEAVREKLSKQIADLLGGSHSLDPDRLHQEAVLIAARADVREELDRLIAHIDAVRALTSSTTAVGRQLDFLAQECGREANTFCAKANDVSLSRIGLTIKGVVEQFREQVQNVE
ncbi:MAG: YicC family protein [Methylobacteriaceae bacterium]|nr:YicC family protein [Methylobacteriaceae bacterium]